MSSQGPGGGEQQRLVIGQRVQSIHGVTPRVDPEPHTDPSPHTPHSDLLQNPLLVPVKVLKGHTLTMDLGVLDVVFHPTQPWVFSSGADGTVRLYT